MKKRLFCLLGILGLTLLIAFTMAACEWNDGSSVNNKFFIQDSAANQLNKNNATKDDAIKTVTDGITNLRNYVNSVDVATTGYYMGMQFNINTYQPQSREISNFHLNIQAQLYTYPYEDENGEIIYKYYDPKDGQYYDEQNAAGTRQLISAQDIHNDVIRNSDIIIEWYNGVTNQMLIGFYFDGINSNAEGDGNILYFNLQGSKRYFPDFGDTVLYQQIIRLLMSLSVENLLVAGDLQGDAGVDFLAALFEVAVNENYKMVKNDPVTSVLFYGLDASLVAGSITDIIQGIFGPFEDKIDPLTNKYLGFKFSSVGDARISTAYSDMQFFSQPDAQGITNILSGAYLTFDGVAYSKGLSYNYVSDVTFEYGAYPPDGMELDKLFYKLYEYGKYEFVGNLYIPMLNSNYDALIRTDMQEFDNSTNNVFMEFRDIANGELMIGAYYKHEKSFIDISGMEYLYGAVALDELGFPQVYDESLNLAEALWEFKRWTDGAIVSIVDGILNPKQDDKESKLLDYIMEKTSMTEKNPNDIFSKNTVTLLIDMELVKQALEETGVGTYTTRDIINILDSLSPYTMDQIAMILGVSSAEVMLDNSYFTVTLNVDTNEITVKMFTNVGVEDDEPSIMIFQLDVIPTKIGEHVNIAVIDFSNFKPLEEIYTYSATMSGTFMFSTAEVVDLSKLLSATIGENSGLNTQFQLPEKTGVSFDLVYDQYVLDQHIDGVLKKAGRSAFQLNVYMTGGATSLIISLASDDVAFNNEVYQNLPERADELGDVWVDIACIYEGVERKIPKIKIREDIFMASMTAYMDGTSIADDAGKLGKSDVNLSITSILFALMEDSYVVLQPERIEITSSNETLQSIFRVKSLIGNIRANAGFRYRVSGLEAIKKDYGLFAVGQFQDMEEYSPYETVLHDTVPVYFYEDYRAEYPDDKYEFRVSANGRLQVYKKGAYQTIMREPIEYGTSTFFQNENANNQDINMTRFRFDALSKLITRENNKFFYLDYDDVKKEIDEKYIREEGNVVYIYYKGISEVLHRGDNGEYYYYDREMAHLSQSGHYVYISTKVSREFLFEYDLNSIEITPAAKTQYAPRINGSFMGEIRRYILVITSPYAVERGEVFELSSRTYYSQEDEENVIEYFDEDGIKIGEEVIPIPLFVFEPCEELPNEVAVNVRVGNNVENYIREARFVIDESLMVLEGNMLLTEVIVAEGTMGERSYPIRVIILNREIRQQEYVNVYAENADVRTSMVPVVDTVEIDPYDYILSKYAYFIDTSNFNPDQYTWTELDAAYAAAEREFTNLYFSQFVFEINFRYESSNLYRQEVKEEYIQVLYNNGAAGERFNWDFDQYEHSSVNKEEGISPIGGNIYLHTHFRGQLIALHVKVGMREFSHVKFATEDTFIKNVDGSIDYKGIDDAERVKDYDGFYSANYFDQSSYVMPGTPIFVFRDATGRMFERVFNMSMVAGLDSNGNYITTVRNGDEVSNITYAISWGEREITNVSSNGSYINIGTDIDPVWVNRPFYESTVIRDENGNVISETITETGNQSEYNTASLNLRWLLKIYKPYRNTSGQYTGQFESINIVKGVATDDFFKSIVIKVKVDCPKLEVANVTSGGGANIIENDHKNLNAEFTPSAVSIGTNPIGYYQIDPLSAETLNIPTEILVYFTSERTSGLVSHRFVEIKWYSHYDEGTQTLNTLNPQGLEVVRYDSVLKKYVFNLSTEEPYTTKVVARIGSDISGYQTITLAINVLSKDPQRVEFYYGTKGNGNNFISGIERLDSNVGLDGAAAVTTEYLYYVDTFAGFNLPTWIRAYFGVDGARTSDYAVSWSYLSGSGKVVFRPNTVVRLKALIGDGDINVTIYLTVVVANYTVGSIDILSELQHYYVKVGSYDNFSYILLADLYQLDLSAQQMGYYRVGGGEQYLVLSTGSEADGAVPIGMLGLYSDVGGVKALMSSMYPYEFIKELYGRVDIIFSDADNVELIDYYFNLTDNSPSSLSAYAKQHFTYNYNAVGGGHTVTADLSGILMEEDIITVYPNSNFTSGTEREIDVREFISAYIALESARDILGWTVRSVTTVTGGISTETTVGNRVLSELYQYAGGTVSFLHPTTLDGGFLFTEMVLEDGTEDGKKMTYEELSYRLTYLVRHRMVTSAPLPIRNKTVVIADYEGIFDINDVVINEFEPIIIHSDKYHIALGTGAGSFDMKLKLLFQNGMRLTSDSAQEKEIEVDAYTAGGHAQYGESGYVLGRELTITVDAMVQDGSGATRSYNYGGTSERLNNWYVTASSFPEIAVGSLIQTIPQSVVYAKTDGSITITALTSQGFRIKRRLTFYGVRDNVSTYNGVSSAGFVINNGNISINDIYNYAPVDSYFGGTRYLPSVIYLTTGGRQITVSDVNWTISAAWSTTTQDEYGNYQPAGKLAGLDYRGTLNSQNGLIDPVELAKAEILGWEGYVDGVLVKHDRVSITLYIMIDTAEVVALPWRSDGLQLDTLAIKETVNIGGVPTEQNVFIVDIDAFNDTASSAMSGNAARFVLPDTFSVTYKSGLAHTFRNVEFLYKNIPITDIPYNQRGIDIDALSWALMVPTSELNRGYIDLTVNLGLSQTLHFRFRFFDKTAANISAVIELNDEDIRNQVLLALGTLSDDKANSLMNAVNLTRIEYNIENLVYFAKAIREKGTMPLSQNLLGALSAAEVEIELNKLIAATLWTGLAPYPEKVPFTKEQCENFTLEILLALRDSKITGFAERIMTVRQSGLDDSVKISRIADIIKEYENELFSEMYAESIRSYVEWELSNLFMATLRSESAQTLNYASYYKNILESTVDVNAIVKETDRIRQLMHYGVYTPSQAEALIHALFLSEIDKAIVKTKGLVGGSDAIIGLINQVFMIRLGFAPSTGSYSEMPFGITWFLANYDVTKVEMRESITEMIRTAMDFVLSNGALTAEMENILTLLVKENIAATPSLSDTVQAIRAALLGNLSATAGITNIFVRGINNFVYYIFMEMKVANAIKRVQAINTASDSYYVIDPYYDYLIVPTRYIVDFDEASGGYSYVTTLSFANNPINGNVNYRGNAKSAERVYIYLWTKFYAGLTNPTAIAFLDAILLNVQAGLIGQDWDDIRRDNPQIYNILTAIQQLAKSYFDDINEANEQEKCKELYEYYLAGIALYNLTTTPMGRVELNSNGIDVDALSRFYDVCKYDELFGLLTLRVTLEQQNISLIVKVLSREVDAGDLEIKDKDGNVYKEIIIEDPFATTKADLPNLVEINGEEFEIVWNNVDISPQGNIAASNKTLTGRIKNAGGQLITVNLTVYRWEYYAIRVLSEGEYKLLSPQTFKISELYPYSEEDDYEIEFRVYSGTGSYTIKRVKFYPEDSRMLINTTDDAEMAVVAARRAYRIFWDNTAVATVKATKPVSGVEGSLYIGNDYLNVNVNSLIASGNTTTTRKTVYTYDRMWIKELQLVDLDKTGALYLEIQDDIMAEFDSPVIMDARSHYPMTGEVSLLNKKRTDAVTVRYLWNQTYEIAHARLVAFVEYGYPEVDAAERNTFVNAILMNIHRTAQEEAALIELAKDYMRYYNRNEASYPEDTCERDALQLLMLYERYDISARTQRLKGGIDNSKLVTVLVQVAGSSQINIQTMTVSVIFSDFTPLAYYNNVGEEIISVTAGAAPTSLYIKVRQEYWLTATSEIEPTIKSKYNTQSAAVFKLLSYHNTEVHTVPLVEITDIQYGSVDSGYLKSQSFKINGITYVSNLINIRVS